MIDKMSIDSLLGKLKLGLITVIIIFLFLSLTGCLGIHSKCENCNGTGFDPVVYPSGICRYCDGDGETGLIYWDEDLEDSVSWSIFSLILIIVIIIIILKVRKGIKKDLDEYYQQHGIPQPSDQQQDQCKNCNKPLRYVQQHQRWYCDNCRKYI